MSVSNVGKILSVVSNESNCKDAIRKNWSNKQKITHTSALFCLRQQVKNAKVQPNAESSKKQIHTFKKCVSKLKSKALMEYSAAKVKRINIFKHLYFFFMRWAIVWTAKDIERFAQKWMQGIKTGENGDYLILEEGDYDAVLQSTAPNNVFVSEVSVIPPSPLLSKKCIGVSPKNYKTLFGSDAQFHAVQIANKVFRCKALSKVDDSTVMIRSDDMNQSDFKNALKGPGGFLECIPLTAVNLKDRKYALSKASFLVQSNDKMDLSNTKELIQNIKKQMNHRLVYASQKGTIISRSNLKNRQSMAFGISKILSKHESNAEGGVLNKSTRVYIQVPGTSAPIVFKDLHKDFSSKNVEVEIFVEKVGGSAKSSSQEEIIKTLFVGFGKDKGKEENKVQKDSISENELGEKIHQVLFHEEETQTIHSGQKFKIRIGKNDYFATIKGLKKGKHHFEKEDEKNWKRGLLTFEINDAVQLKFKADESLNVKLKKSEEDPIKSGIPVSEYMQKKGLIGIPKKLDEALDPILLLNGKHAKKMEKLNISKEKGILLTGPPGTGKTRFVSHLANYLGIDDENVRIVAGTDLLNKWVGESESNIRKLFEVTNDQLTLVAIDEIDSLLSKRSDDDQGHQRKLVNAVLTAIAGFEQNKNIIVFGITNKPELLDEAGTRSGRLGLKIEFELPKKEERVKIFKHYLGDCLDTTDSESVLQRFADKTDKSNGADIENIVNRAKIIAGQKYVKKHQEDDDDAEILVTEKDLEEAFKFCSIKKPELPSMYN